MCGVHGSEKSPLDKSSLSKTETIACKWFGFGLFYCFLCFFAIFFTLVRFNMPSFCLDMRHHY